MDKPILIACDGSALKTRDGKIGGPIGWAWAREDGHWMSAGLPAGTNQRAELWALLSTLIFHPKGDLHIQSDSQYTLNVAQKWRWGWARNSWRKAGGEPVLNQDLIRPLHELLINRKGNITYQWVKGHLKDNRYPLNTEADLRAQQASNKAKTFTFDPLAPYNYADSKNRDHSPTMQQLFEWVGIFAKYQVQP